ncbi:15583_t:CDS:2, partial [Gigaspora margarita]
EMVSKNAAAQKQLLSIKKENAKKLVELQATYEVVRNLQLKNDILHRIFEEVVIYDSPGQPSLLFDYLDLHEHIYDCIDFKKADSKQRHEVIKVRTINHLHSVLEDKYNEYLLRTTLNNYLLP